MAKRVPAAQSELLILVGTVIAAETTTPFVAHDRFVVNTKKDAPVKISYLGYGFKAWFLEKEEQPFGGSALSYAKLSRPSIDISIITALGGEEKAETTLTELFSLMQAQKNGESGSLLTNGWANIFYVKDVFEMIRTVCAYWYDDGWRVYAYSFTMSDSWNDHYQVFSRNS